MNLSFIIIFVLLKIHLGGCRYIEDVTDLKSSYDYIIAGGGTSGLTIGDRLSESGEYNVLVIENGYLFNASDPADSYLPWRRYNITSIPQPHIGNRTIDVLVGHGVGGCSSINGPALQRGSAGQYNTWAKLGYDNTKWTFDDMLPSFKKASHFIPPDESLAAEFNITYDPSVWGQYNSTRHWAIYPGGFNYMRKFMMSALATFPGIPFPRGGHSGYHGAFYYPLAVDPVTHLRSYARTAHWDGLERPNYDLLTGHRVNKILLHGIHNTATGVQFVPKNKDTMYTIQAKREVIVAAGALHTPQVLQLSGIGPAPLLAAAGVELKVDLAGVGQNFQDHPIGPNVSYQFATNPIVPPNLTFPNYTGWGADQGQVADLSLPVVVPDDYERIADLYESQDIATISLPNADPKLLAGYRAQQRLWANGMRDKEISFLQYLIPPGPSGIPVGLFVTSRGTVNINITDPESEPIVDYRALSNPVDLELMVAYIKFLRRFLQSPPFAEYNMTELHPGPLFDTDDKLRQYVRSGYSPEGWHPVGTAAKMRRELGGVVDDELRVYGVRGLRVVDASIMPTLPGGATQHTVYAIAEKAATIIKAGW